MEVHAPWPDDLPSGRLLAENCRHMTLAFLGNVDFGHIEQALPSFPKPPFKVGFAGRFDKVLFLPPHHARVVAWHIEWLHKTDEISKYYQNLTAWLKLDTNREFLSHVTLARGPFNEKEWSHVFSPLPAFVQDIHLYESLGNLRYAPIWTYKLLPPFTELDHTADIAYQINGDSYEQLFTNGFLALCFNFPQILSYFPKSISCNNLEDVIIELNHLVAIADQEIGCPFKAVSFHSHLENRGGIMQWEMIIDV